MVTLVASANVSAAVDSNPESSTYLLFYCFESYPAVVISYGLLCFKPSTSSRPR